MPICIATDEAGYGPNLGPLVIAATAWKLPDQVDPGDLWKLLSPAVRQNRQKNDARLMVADSKQVYSASGSIRELERSVLSFLHQLSADFQTPRTLGELGRFLAKEGFDEQYRRVCGEIVNDLDLPAAVNVETCRDNARQLGVVLSECGVSLMNVRCRIIFPPEFNEFVGQTGSKGILLSRSTLALVREVVDTCGSDPCGTVVCDKHGGRNRYDELISEAFDDQFVFRLQESAQQSRYRVQQLEFCFRTRAEELLPVALSSMVAKYMRELVMMQFNRFWMHHLPEIKPTKGYPVDAKRFWDDIAETASALGICRQHVWRCK